MKQIERGWKAAQDDATDDEVKQPNLSQLTHLTLPRIMCCRRLTLMAQSKVLITDSDLSSRHVAEHTSRLIVSLRTMSSERCSTDCAQTLLIKMTMRTILSKISPAALLNSLDLTVPKQSYTTTSTVLPMLHTISRGHHRRHVAYRRLKSSPMIKRPCSCFLPIFRQHRRLIAPTPLLKILRTHTSLDMQVLLSLISLLLHGHRQFRCQAHPWLFRPGRRLIDQQRQRKQVSTACVPRRRSRVPRGQLTNQLLHEQPIASWICLTTIQIYQL